MAVTDLSVLADNGTAFFGVATGLVSPAWANFRALTEFKNLEVDGNTYEIVSRAINTVTGTYEYDQTLFQFDTSGITDATAAEFRINCTSITNTPKSILFKGNCSTPFTDVNGLNRMFNWPTSPTPYSTPIGTAISTGMHSVTLNADGISDINSGHTLQIYLVEYHQGNDATAPTGTDNFRASFNNINLALRVTTPDPQIDYIKISNGAIKILSGKVSL